MVILANAGTQNSIELYGENTTESYGQVITIPQDGFISKFSFFTKNGGLDGTTTIKAFIYIYNRTTNKLGNKLYEGNAKNLTTSSNFEKQTETINESVAVNQNDEIIFLFSTLDSNGNDLAPSGQTAEFVFQEGTDYGVNNFFVYTNNNNWSTATWSKYWIDEMHYEIEIQDNQIICFPENTPVTTDQGIVAIQDLEKDSYTINGNKVLGVVSHKPKSSIDMVLFKQHALGYNMPSKDTLMTRNHQVYYNNIPRDAIAYTTNAFKLNKTILKGVPNNPKPKVMQYNKEVYNVMLEDGHKMKVNNMLVETLHPSNKLYKLRSGNK